ncbi:hypothetical protein ECG_02688 [Echinococcus granulosus]|nr:hypothetical protein ECG_02688 [Echinococcus granulosus]
MNANMMERRRKVTEELISQIEGCLPDRLLREQFSDLYHPIPALVPQISGHSSFRTVCSSTSESSKKATFDSPNSALENIPPMNKNSPQTSIKDAETNHLNKGGGPDEASLSNTGELSSYVPKASDLEPGVNWRLLQQIRSRNASKFAQSNEKRGLPSASHASPLNEAQYLDKSSAVTAFTTKSILTRPSIGENRDLLAEDTRSRARWVKSPDKAVSASLTKKATNEKGERRPSQQRRNLHDSQLIAKIRTQKPSDCLSERQLNGYRSLQRRLEYDPRASVAKERLKSKIWENRNNNADGSCATPTSNRDGEVGEAAKAKATGRQSSIDSKVQSPPGQRKLIGVTQRTDSPAPRCKNHRIVGTSGDAPNRSATNSPFDRT